MPADDALRLAAEQRARVLIDAQLTAAGWSVQDKGDLNLFLPGVAVREMVMAPGHGRADYVLYVDRRVVGVIEAKPQGTPLSGVEWQSAMYATGLPDAHRKRATVLDGRLPFVFEASGSLGDNTAGGRLRRACRTGDGWPWPCWATESTRRGHAAVQLDPGVTAMGPQPGHQVRGLVAAEGVPEVGP